MVFYIIMVCGIGVMLMPPKPEEIKSLIRNVRAGLDPNKDVKLNSITVWSFNKLPRYLWSYWEDELRKCDLSWQEFLAILKLYTKDIADWTLKNRLTWDELVEKLRGTIMELEVES